MPKPKSWDKLATSTKQRIERRIRAAAAAVKSDLIEISPNWSGQFRQQWQVDALVATTGVDGRGIPKLALNDYDLLSPALEVYDIYNTSPYALIAMDLEPGFFAPTTAPRGPIVLKGKREDDNIRGHISGQGKNRATAERDWYQTYVTAGGLTQSVERSRIIL